jgi:chaperone required for assembly of F1-ATPase
MPWAKRRRTYSKIGTAVVDGGFAVLLDGRALKTPQGQQLVLASQALAAAMAGELAAQRETLDPETMLITRLACAVVDRVGVDRNGVVGHVVNYGGTDLLCYHAQRPGELAARQQAAWGPLLKWAATELDARLAVTEGVAPVAQPTDALARLRRAVEALDDARLTALTAVAEASGSLVIALALVMGRIDANEATTAAQIDETWQSEKWGKDPDAAARRQALAQEIAAAARFLDLIGR